MLAKKKIKSHCNIGHANHRGNIPNRERDPRVLEYASQNDVAALHSRRTQVITIMDAQIAKFWNEIDIRIQLDAELFGINTPEHQLNALYDRRAVHDHRIILLVDEIVALHNDIIAIENRLVDIETRLNPLIVATNEAQIHPRMHLEGRLIDFIVATNEAQIDPRRRPERWVTDFIAVLHSVQTDHLRSIRPREHPLEHRIPTFIQRQGPSIDVHTRPNEVRRPQITLPPRTWVLRARLRLFNTLITIIKKFFKRD